VVIPVYNRKNFIEQCLSSVLQQQFSGDYEVIVIDDGSTDGTGEILKQFLPKIRLHTHGKNEGLSSARNRGIQLSQGRFIAMLDSDCVAAPDWLEKIIQPFDADSGIMIVGGHVNDAPPRNYWEIVNKGINFVSHHSGNVEHVIGCNMALRREFALQNPFDECPGFAAGDDTELCLRCRCQGFKVYYTREAAVVHYHRSSFRSSLTQQFFYGYADAYLSFQYYSFPYVNFQIKFWAGIILCLGILFLGFIGFWWVAVLGFLRVAYVPWYYSGISKAKNLRERIFTYPGYCILFIALCLGSLVYFLFPHAFLNRSKAPLC